MLETFSKINGYNDFDQDKHVGLRDELSRRLADYTEKLLKRDFINFKRQYYCLNGQ